MDQKKKLQSPQRKALVQITSKHGFVHVTESLQESELEIASPHSQGAQAFQLHQPKMTCSKSNRKSLEEKAIILRPK